MLKTKNNEGLDPKINKVNGPDAKNEKNEGLDQKINKS